MKTLPLLLLAALPLGGCGDNSMSQKEVDAAKNARLTDADRAKMGRAMADGFQKDKAANAEWAAKQDPAKLAQINAQRAALGRPPIGG